LRLGDARALMALTDDDLANLEVALGARARHPGLRIVMRLFDTDLAERAGRALQIRISRSVSALAAPRFVAALLRRKILATIPVGSRALVVVEAAAPAGYATVSAIERGFEVRVLEAGSEWRPPREEPLAPGAPLVLIATREGLGALADAGAA
jgi:Trk K+ transport system NAD-binding subunit